ncbi:MAG: zinc ribbon domain-containing protein [Lachnospiraceae bacterium]|nr:zinc ribbon domain-containing protein [Lachnospiraceae bacterium]
MAFCAKCGSPLEEGAGFCTACGRKVGTAVVNQTSNNGNVSEGHQVFYGNMDPNSEEAKRFKITADFAVFKDYFSKKEKEYYELDKLNKRINHLMRNSQYSNSLVAGILLTIVGAVPIILHILKYINFEANIAIVYILGLLFLVPGIIMLIFNLIKIPLRIKAISLEPRKNELIDELQQYYRKYPGIVPVGIEYTTPDMIYQIGEMIRTGKASTFEGALRQLETEKHHANLELANWARVDAINNVADAINRL